jgi:hypothetical protein
VLKDCFNQYVEEAKLKTLLVLLLTVTMSKSFANAREDRGYDYTQFFKTMQTIPYIGNIIWERERYISVVVALDMALKKLPNVVCKMGKNSVDLTYLTNYHKRMLTGETQDSFVEDIRIWEGKTDQPMIVIAIHNYGGDLEANRDHALGLISYRTDESGSNIEDISFELYRLQRVNVGSLRKPKFAWALSEQIESGNCFRNTSF